jgi:putative ABC transport system permease protein
MRVDPGFQRDRVLVTQVFAWDYNRGPAALRAFFDTTLTRLTAMPSVQAAGAVSAMPFIESNIGMQGPLTIPRRPAAAGEAPRSFLTVATPGYFEVMQIPLRRGRHLAASDGPDNKKVAVITESLARRYWDGTDPIGERVQFRLSGQPLDVEIVGIVGSLRHDSLDRVARDELFVPLTQNPFGSMTFVVRSAGDATSLLAPTRDAIWSVNAAQTIYRDATLDELVLKTVSPRRFGLSVVLTFAAVALLLSALGVYGVLSAIMTSRVREIGVRVALGASHRDIIRLVLQRGLVMTGLGVAVGLAASIASARLLESFLFEITPADPASLGVAAGVMTLVAALACYVPARRAAGADPVTVLRSD